MKREKNLIVNSILYLLGSLGKGVASTLIVFIGSFYVMPDEMGIYDLVISTISLLQPLIIFQINDGIYRWLLDENNSKTDVIKCGVRIAYRNMIVANIIMVIVFAFWNIENKLLIAILLNLNCLYPIFQQVTRGLKNHRIFAISGIITGTLVLSLSFVTMEFLGMGVEGFYIAQIISNIVGIIYLGVSQKISISPFSADKNAIKAYSNPMQKYSILLVPNSINQWIMKALDKYCILFFFTPYANGLYTVAHRFPDILIMLNSMFYSAWVEQSIVEYDSEDRDAYFSKIYNIYSKVIVSIVLVAIPVTKYLMQIFTGSEYYSAYKYVSFLYIGVIFYGLSSFVGTGYLSTKKTGGILWTSLAGSVTNVVINIIFMPLFGLQIAGISSVCAYFIMWFIRIKQTRKFFKIDVEWGSFIPMISMTVIFAFLVQSNNIVADIGLTLIALIVALVANREIMHFFIKKLVKRK